MLDPHLTKLALSLSPTETEAEPSTVNDGGGFAEALADELYDAIEKKDRAAVRTSVRNLLRAAGLEDEQDLF